MRRFAVLMLVVAACSGTDPEPAPQPKTCASVAVFDHYLVTQQADQRTVEAVFSAPFPDTAYNIGYVARSWSGTAAAPALALDPTATVDRQLDRVRLTFPTTPGTGVTITWDVAVACVR